MVVDSRDAYLNSMDPKQFSHFDNFRHFTLIHNTLGLNFRECMRETEKIVRYVDRIRTTFKYDLNVWLWGWKNGTAQKMIFFFILLRIKLCTKVQRQDIGLNAENKPKDDGWGVCEREGDRTREKNRCGDKYSTESHIKAVKIKVENEKIQRRHRSPSPSFDWSDRHARTHPQKPPNESTAPSKWMDGKIKSKMFHTAHGVTLWYCGRLCCVLPVARTHIKTQAKLALSKN